MPTEMPRGMMKVNEGDEGESMAWQTWHLNGTRCPKGTVPIRRSTVHDVLRAKSLYDFGKKRSRLVPLSRRNDAPDVLSANGHEVYNLFTLQKCNFSEIDLPGVARTPNPFK